MCHCSYNARANNFMIKMTSSLGLICVLAGSLILVSCSSQAGSSETAPSPTQPVTESTVEEQPEPLTIHGKKLMAEYQTALSEFPESLPDGVGFPDTLPPALLKNNYVAEMDVGERQAAFYWLCAWQDVFLTAESIGDQAAADVAFDRLASGWKSLPYHEKHVDDPHQVWRKEILGPAKLGNDRPLKQYFNTSCSFYQEHNPS